MRFQVLSTNCSNNSRAKQLGTCFQVPLAAARTDLTNNAMLEGSVGRERQMDDSRSLA
jgi:hypothetical protein